MMFQLYKNMLISKQASTKDFVSLVIVLTQRRSVKTREFLA